MPRPSSHQPLQPPLTVHFEGIQEEDRLLAVDKACIKAGISWSPNSCILPYTENSWTYSGWFSLFNNNLLMFWPPELFCKSSYISWFLTYLFGAVPQSYLRDCLPGLHPQYICQIRHNSQLLGCAFLLPHHPHPQWTDVIIRVFTEKRWHEDRSKERFANAFPLTLKMEEMVVSPRNAGNATLEVWKARKGILP